MSGGMDCVGRTKTPRGAFGARDSKTDGGELRTRYGATAAHSRADGSPLEPPPFPTGGSATGAKPPNRQTTNGTAMPTFTIVIDTREQTPLTFPASVPTVRDGLHTGDYSIRGFEDRFTVERKSLSDLVHTLIHDRARFVRELERMKPFAFRRVICTASMEAVRRGNYSHSRANPKSVVATIATFEIRYRVPFVFAGSSDEAARRIVDWAQYFTRECALRDHERMLAGRVAGGSGGTDGANVANGATPPPTLGSYRDPLNPHPNPSGAVLEAIPPAVGVKNCQKVQSKVATDVQCQNTMKGNTNHAPIT